MTLKLRRKPLTTIRRISDTDGADLSTRGFWKKIARPVSLFFGIGLMAVMTQSYLEGGETYPVRPAVYEQRVNTSPVVRTVGYQTPQNSSVTAKSGDSVSAAGTQLSWVPVHSSQGQAILQNRSADVQSVDDMLNSLTVESRPAELPALTQRNTQQKWIGTQSENVTLTRIPEVVRDERVVPAAYVPVAGSGRTVLTREEPLVAQSGAARLDTLNNVPGSGPRGTSPLAEPSVRGGYPGGSMLDREGMTFMDMNMDDMDLDMDEDYMEESELSASPRAIGPGSRPESFRSDDDYAPAVLPPTTGRALPGADNMAAPRSPYFAESEPSVLAQDEASRGVLDPAHCPKPKEMKPINQITNNIKTPEGTLPTFCPLVTPEDRFPVRQFAGTQFTWTASNLCHNPLYFEQPDVERYGHSAGPVLQPILSGAQFLLTIPYMPSLLAMNPPNECVYPLGHYRPGSCAPYMFHPLPVSVRGLIAEGGVIAGLVFLIP